MIWVNIAMTREPRILHVMVNQYQSTAVDGFSHPLGTCMKGFEMVWKVFQAVMLAIPAKTPLPLRSPETECFLGGLPGPACGCMVP